MRRSVGLIAVLFAAWMLPALFAHDPWKPDEGYSFGLVYELLSGGSWIVPTLAGEPFMEKPPLFYLTAAGFASLLSDVLPLHDGARVATAFYMALCSAFVALAAREISGRDAALPGAALFIGSTGLLLPGHLLITDVAQLAGIAAVFYGLLLALRRPLAGAAVTGIGLVVAFLSKGLLMMGVAVLLAIVLPLLHARWREPWYPRFLLIAFLVALPGVAAWPLLLHARSPQLFDEWLWANNIGRFLGSNTLGPAARPLHYLWILPWFALPSLPLAIYGVWARRGALARDAAHVTVLAGTLVLLAVLSVSATARQLYALPLLVPLALAAVPGVAALPERWSRALCRAEAALVYAALATLWLAAIAWASGWPAVLHERLALPQDVALPGVRSVITALLYTAAFVVVLKLSRSSRWRPAFVWAAGITAAWGVAASLFLGLVDAYKSYAPLMTEVRAHLPPAYRCVASQGLGEPQRALIHYHVGIRTRRIETRPDAGECDVLLVENRPGPEIAPGPHFERIWSGKRRHSSPDYFVLYRRTP